MKLILITLAAFGLAAVLQRLLRSAFRAVRHGAYSLYAREIAANRARRGDLTGLEEARGWVVYARKERLQALGWAGLWFVLLVLPLSVPSRPLPVYAIYAAVWLIPSHPWRERWVLGKNRTPGGGPR